LYTLFGLGNPRCTLLAGWGNTLNPKGVYTGDAAIQIRFKTPELQQAYQEEKAAQRLFSDAKRARLYQRRIKDLEAAETLALMSAYPGGCHPLKGTRRGQYALRLWGGLRLVIVPAHDPLPLKDDGGLDLARVIAIEISSVEDYHG
jgi:proteic killer suppression protein